MDEAPFRQIDLLSKGQTQGSAHFVNKKFLLSSYQKTHTSKVADELHWLATGL